MLKTIRVNKYAFKSMLGAEVFDDVEISVEQDSKITPDNFTMNSVHYVGGDTITNLSRRIAKKWLETVGNRPITEEELAGIGYAMLVGGSRYANILKISVGKLTKIHLGKEPLSPEIKDLAIAALKKDLEAECYSRPHWSLPNENGFTLPELLLVIVGVGTFSLVGYICAHFILKFW